MEHNLVSLHWPVDLAGEDDLGRNPKDPNPAKQDAGRDSPGQCDAGRDRQDSGSHRPTVRQAQ